MRDLVYFGTEMKVIIGIEPIGSYTMDDYNFFCEFFCSPKKTMTIEKAQMTQRDENNYIAKVSSEEVGTGVLKCRITAYIPDADFDDGLRTEVQLLDTGITITKG